MGGNSREFPVKRKEFPVKSKNIPGYGGDIFTQPVEIAYKSVIRM
jgi:hypothetical protein